MKMEMSVQIRMGMIHVDWLQLPVGMTTSIFMKLNTDVLFKVENVCSSWRIICRDPFLWRSIKIDDSYTHFHSEFYEDIIKLAVDRSCGELQDITLLEYADYNLFRYISHRSKHLRSLKLYIMNSDSSFVEELRRFPLLTELELWIWPFHEVLEDVGRYCPLLTSFKLITYNSSRGSPSDRDALAIAGQMQGLVNLGLVGNGLTNYGLKAVIDSCPGLRFLDLRRCYNVDLGGEFGKKCVEKVQVLRRPEESTDDLGLKQLNHDYLRLKQLNDDDDYDDFYYYDYYNDYVGSDSESIWQ